MLSDILSVSRARRLSHYIKHLPGLQAYYPLNETSGTKAYNRAPATQGTLNGTITGATVGQPGKAGKAYSFDGNDDDIAFTGLNPSAGSFSLGMLFKRNGNQDAGDRLFDQMDSGPTNGFNLGFTDATSFNFSIRNVTTDVVAINSGALTDLTWYFIVATYQQNSAKLFINGWQVGVTDTTCTMTAASATPKIGRRAGQVINDLNGSVQHAFYCNQVITPTQILKLAQLAGLA